jgi:hypothetical protein
MLATTLGTVLAIVTCLAVTVGVSNLAVLESVGVITIRTAVIAAFIAEVVVAKSQRREIMVAVGVHIGSFFEISISRSCPNDRSI